MINILLKVLALLITLVITIVFYSLWERRFIGFVQDRLGPNRVGAQGLLQPIADVIKLFLKTMIIPDKSNKFLFILGPVLSTVAAVSAWAVIPFNQQLVLANLNIGLLYILAITGLGVYGIIIAGWASNSKYALLGAVRSAVQMISYSIPMSFAVIGVIIKANSMNLINIVMLQQGGIRNWLFIPLLPLLIVYWVCAMAETNRLPFDVAEGESELVAGFHVEYSAMGFALLFLAEYSNMILASMLTVVMFFGGWLSPFTKHLLWVPGSCWLLLKAFILMTLFLWIRATFPRYRYDQIMRLCWKGFIPLTLLWIIVEVIWLDPTSWLLISGMIK